MHMVERVLASGPVDGEAEGFLVRLPVGARRLPSQQLQGPAGTFGHLLAVGVGLVEVVPMYAPVASVGRRPR